MKRLFFVIAIGQYNFLQYIYEKITRKKIPESSRRCWLTAIVYTAVILVVDIAIITTLIIKFVE